MAMNSTYDLTLETVILLVFGMFMILFGLLRFWIDSGLLPYNPDSTYGLLLVIASIQIITMGKTPFGTFRRTWMLFILGIGMAVIGTVACFIPGLLGDSIRELIGIIFFSGGIILFLQLILSREKAKRWFRIPGILRHLTIACSLAYLMEVLFGLVSLFPDNTPDWLIFILPIFFGLSFFYLAWCLQKISQIYPRKGTPDPDSGITVLRKTKANDRFFLLQEVSVPTPVSFILLLGVIFIFFAILLIPVSQGNFPFSRDSQFGLLMVIMAIQVLALGKTPLGVYQRSWVLIFIGFVIVSIGIYACIVPGLLTGWMMIPLGIWNIITGSSGLGRLFIPLLQGIRHPPDEPVPCSPAVLKLLVTATLLYLASMMFGVNLILPGLIPGLAVLAILFALGFLFLLLAYILMSLPASKGTNRTS